MVKFRGLANDAGEQVEEVVEEEGETLELQEARVTASYQRGLRLMKEKRLADATSVWLETMNDKAFERDITGNQRFITLRNVQYLCVKNLAAVAEELNDKETALEWLGQAVALDDRDVVVWHKLGCIAQELDRLNIARCSFERGLCLRPQHQLCMERLCEVTYGIGDFEACESAADQLLRLVPSHPRAMLHKSLAMSHRGNSELYWQDVLEDAREADPVGVAQLEKKLTASRAKRSRIERPAQESAVVELPAVSWRCLVHEILKLLRKGAESVGGAQNAFGSLITVSIAEASTDPEADGLTLIKMRKEEKKDEEGKKGCAAEESEGGEEEGADKQQEEEEEYDDRDALCTRCGGDNEQDDDLLLCERFERCGRSFHLTCLRPPLSKTPKGKWFCDKCEEQRRPSKHAATPKPPPAPSTPKGSRSSGRRARDESKEGAGEGSLQTPTRDDSPNPTPTKKRRSDRFSQPAPDSFRKSLRHSAASEQPRHVGAEALSKILNLVLAPDGGERAEEAVPAERSEAGPPTESAGAKEEGESSKAALSRLQMLQQVPDLGASELQAVKELLQALPAPCCLLELVYRLLHTLARLSRQCRARGKLLDLLLELDVQAFDRLTYSPEASLALAELHFDASLRKIEERKRKKAEEEEERKEAEEERKKAEAAKEKERKKQEEKERKEGKDPEKRDAAGVAAEAPPEAAPDAAKPADNAEGGALQAPAQMEVERAEEPAKEDPHVAACVLHLTSLWTDRLQAPADRARHFWLKARLAEAQLELSCAVESYRRCRDIVAQCGTVLLPSCVFGNSISAATVDKCSREPGAELESQILGQRLKELMSRISNDAGNSNNEGIAKEVVRVLAPVVMPEIQQERQEWLVSRPHVKWVCDTEKLKEARAKRQDYLCMLLDAFRWLPDHWRQELYAMNVMLAELVGVDQVLVEKEDPVLFQTLEGDRLRSVLVILNYVAYWTSQYASSFAELQDKGGAKMLHQLEVQVARLFCRLAACKQELLKEHNVVMPGNVQGPNVFYVAGMVLYRLFKNIRVDCERQKEREMLSKVLEELLKRNLQLSHGADFFKTYVPILHLQRVILEEEEDAEAEEEDNEDEDANAADDEGDDDDDGEEDDGEEEDELDAVMHELAKCYYLLFGVRMKCYKSTYDRVDALLVKEEEPGATPSRNKPKVDKSDPQIDFCVGLWEFVKARFDKSHGGREKHMAVQNVKEVLESLRSVLPEPSPDLAIARDLVVSYLFVAHHTHARALPAFSSSFSEQLDAWKAARAARLRAQAEARMLLHRPPAAHDPAGALPAATQGAEQAQQAPAEGDTAASVLMQAADPAAEPQSTGNSVPEEPAAAAAPTGQPTSAADACEKEAAEKASTSGHGSSTKPGDGGADREKSTGGGEEVGMETEGGGEAEKVGGGGEAEKKAEAGVAGEKQTEGEGQGEKSVEESGGTSKEVAKKAPSAGDFEGVGRLPEVYKGLYMMLARCYQQSNDKGAAELFTLDLWMNPERLKSWVGLARAYRSLLHTGDGFGIREDSTLEHSPEAEEMLFKLSRAWSAVRALDASNIDARMGTGEVLYLRAQSGSVLTKQEDVTELRNMAYGEFEEVVNIGGEKADWRAHFFLGILARKMKKPASVCLEHLFKAAQANSEGETLGLEPLYKLHATRAKLLLQGCEDLSLLDQYAVSRCLERATEAEGKDGDESSSLHILAASTKWMQQAQQEQKEYEDEAGPLFEDDSGPPPTRSAILRDCLIAVRAVILAAKSRTYGQWTYAKGRYRVAQIVASREAQPAEKRCDFVLKMLFPLFFNDKEVILANNVSFSFMIYSKEQAKLATYSNLSNLMRLKIKTVELLSRNLRAKQPRSEATERLEKLLDFLLKEEKELGKSISHVWRDANSMRKGIVSSVQNYLSLLQEVLVEEASDADAVERAFLKLGKLRADLEQQAAVCRGVKLTVHESMNWTKEEHDTNFDTVTLYDKCCPFIRLFRAACTAYSKLRSIPYHETQQDDLGSRCMGGAVSVWTGAYKKQQLMKQASQPSRLKSSSAKPAAASSKEPDGEERGEGPEADKEQSGNGDTEMATEKTTDEAKAASEEQETDKQDDKAEDRPSRTRSSARKGVAMKDEEEKEQDEAANSADDAEKSGVAESAAGGKSPEGEEERAESKEPQQFFVVVPANVSAGMTILVALPNGKEQVSVVIPEGNGPGDRFIYTHEPGAEKK